MSEHLEQLKRLAELRESDCGGPKCGDEGGRNMSKSILTPEVKAALESWREVRRRRLGQLTPVEILADAFAALYPEPPPELEPGAYDCLYEGVKHVLVVQSPASGAESRFNFISIDIDSATFKDELPPDVTNIRRIDGGVAWREWAEKQRAAATVAMLMRDAAGYLRSGKTAHATADLLSVAARELETLLKGE